MKDMKKVQELINKLLAVTSENGATENEVITATTKVRELLAKYDMDMSDVVDIKEEMQTASAETSNDKWKNTLGAVIAQNFGCKVYISGKNMVFYGYKRHCETAKEVFKAIYEFGRKRATEIYKEYNSIGRDVRGIKNQFYIGFVRGVKSAFDVQSRALMIITPPEVETEYRKFSVNFKTIKNRISYRRDDDIYDRGVNAGREIASRKAIVG